MKLEANKWYPIEEYHKRNNMDWALVQFKETKTGFMPLPIVAEFNKKDRVWETRSDMDRYFCEMCEAVAFMLWLPYDERDRELFLKSLEDKEVLEDD